MMKRSILGGTVAVIALGFTVWAFLPGGTEKVKANTIVLPIRNFALNVDPSTLAETESRKVATLLYTGLIAVDKDGKVSPRIARKWSQTDLSTWQFTLTEGLTFSDGTPVDAAMVVRSLCASMQPSHVQSWSMKSVEQRPTADGKSVECTGLRAPDPKTVIVRERQPTPWLLEALAGPGGWIVNVDAPTQPYGAKPGTGPYVVDAVVPDRQITLKARSAGAAVAPRAASLIFRYQPDNGVLAQQFQAGEFDLVEVDNPNIAALLLPNGVADKKIGYHIESYATQRVRVVAFNPKMFEARGSTADQARRFMDAYAAAIDRGRIAARFPELAQPLLSGFPPTPEIGRQPVVPPAASTVEGNITLLTENDPFSDLVAAMLPTSVDGIQITYRAVEKSLLIAALLDGKYDLALLKLEATHANPRFWASFFTPGDPYTVFGNAIEGVQSADLTTSGGINEVGELINRQGTWIGVIQETGIYIATESLTGLRLTPAGQLSLEEIGRK